MHQVGRSIVRWVISNGACPDPSAAGSVGVGAAAVRGAEPESARAGVSTPRYSRSPATTATRTPSGERASAVTGPFPASSSEPTRSRLGFPVVETRYTSGLVAPFWTTHASSPPWVKLGWVMVSACSTGSARSVSWRTDHQQCLTPAGVGGHRGDGTGRGRLRGAGHDRRTAAQWAGHGLTVQQPDDGARGVDVVGIRRHLSGAGEPVGVERGHRVDRVHRLRRVQRLTVDGDRDPRRRRRQGPDQLRGQCPAGLRGRHVDPGEIDLQSALGVDGGIRPQRGFRGELGAHRAGQRRARPVDQHRDQPVGPVGRGLADHHVPNIRHHNGSGPVEEVQHSLPERRRELGVGQQQLGRRIADPPFPVDQHQVHRAGVGLRRFGVERPFGVQRTGRKAADRDGSRLVHGDLGAVAVTQHHHRHGAGLPIGLRIGGQVLPGGGEARSGCRVQVRPRGGRNESADDLVGLLTRRRRVRCDGCDLIRDLRDVEGSARPGHPGTGRDHGRQGHHDEQRRGAADTRRGSVPLDTFGSCSPPSCPTAHRAGQRRRRRVMGTRSARRPVFCGDSAAPG